tara:strand:- start:93 stop:197 length:105 start_codon:yes stop_codon:yes gene_type:complete
MVLRFIKKIWKFLTEEEGMTWERYHRNMDRRHKK